MRKQTGRCWSSTLAGSGLGQGLYGLHHCGTRASQIGKPEGYSLVTNFRIFPIKWNTFGRPFSSSTMIQEEEQVPTFHHPVDEITIPRNLPLLDGLLEAHWKDSQPLRNTTILLIQHQVITQISFDRTLANFS